jgi:protease-4
VIKIANKKQQNRWGVVIGVLVVLFIIAYIFSGLLSLAIGGAEQTGNVAIIPVKGVILTQGSQDLFGSRMATSTDIMEDIRKADENPAIDAIIIEIDSPGGAPVASDEIARAVKGANKTTVAWVREVGASGAYWIASSADYVVANRMSLTGSIGVIGSYLQFSGLMDGWNITYERLVAGKYKDMGSAFRELTDEEERIIQKKLDIIHQEFKDAVQENRGLSNDQINAVGNGEWYLGLEAKDLDLVDELGGHDEVISYIESNLNITAKTLRYEHEPSLLEVLMGVMQTRGFSLQNDGNVGMLK